MIAGRHIVQLALLTGLLLSSCSPQALHEAQRVVAEADSLRTEGVAYTDSVTMAEAYNTLEKWQYLYPTDYARACYYYGRLLRNNDDPVAAMQVFINATHTNTRDYHILGRIYSNMGSICHLASEYQLSYDMYSRSANLFLQNGDTLLYYYGLNNMAVELAVQGEEVQTRDILSIIQQYDNRELRIKTYETEALLSQYIGDYGRVIFIIDSIQGLGYTDVLGDVIKARAYSYLNQPDSALYYVRKVLPRTQNPAYLVDVYYISSHDDKTLPVDSILAITSQRADIQKIWGQEQGSYAQSVQLLEQDLHRRPNLMWLYAIIGTCVLIGCILCVYIVHKKKCHQLLSQQVTHLEDMHNTEQQRLEKMVQEHTEYESSLLTQIKQTCIVFYNSEHLKEDLSWSNFDLMCDVVNQQLCFIAKKLQSTYSLRDKEVRLCILVLIGISNSKQLADMLCYGESGIRNFKNRTAKKLSTNSIELRNKLLKIAVGEYSTIIK